MQKIALYRKYRSENFDELVGQEHVTRVLKNAVKSSKISHAYLFSGPRGTGKTSVARILAKVINCIGKKDGYNPCGKCNICKGVAEGRIMDLIEIDAASNRGIDEIRDLREKVKFSPTEGEYKVFIIDEVHMLTKEAFNALLKTLEEPPAHAIFILATTEINKVPATIISRCQRHDFKRIKLADIVARLSDIKNKEGISISDDALEMIAETSEGGLRDAISLLDQLSSLGLTKIEETDVEGVLGLAPHKVVAELVTDLLRGERDKAIKLVERAGNEGVDLIILSKSAQELVRKLLFVKLSGADGLEGTKEQIEELTKLAESTEIETIIQLSDLLIWAAGAFKTMVDPKNIMMLLCAKMDGSGAVVIVEKTVLNDQKAVKSESRQEIKGTSELNTKQLNGKWQHFLMEIKSKNNTIHAFLRVASPSFTEKDKLTLTFPYKFHKEKLEESKNKRMVEDILEKVYGFHIEVTCQLDGARHTNQKVSDVNEAASILGGEIVD